MLALETRTRTCFFHWYIPFLIHDCGRRVDTLVVNRDEAEADVVLFVAVEVAVGALHCSKTAGEP
jgi:hypothetical protein